MSRNERDNPTPAPANDSREALTATETEPQTEAPTETESRANRSRLDRLYLEIYEGEFRYVWTQLRRMGVSTADLPDVTQDVFMIVHRRLPTFDVSRPVRPWLFGILFRAAADSFRLHRRTQEVQPKVWLDGADPRPKPDEALMERQARGIAAGILAALDPRLRTVLVMHDLGDLDANQIATQLGIPLKTVYTRLRLARARFAAAGERPASNPSRNRTARAS